MKSFLLSLAGAVCAVAVGFFAPCAGAAGDVAGSAATLKITLQDRLPFDAQLRAEADALREQANAKDVKKADAKALLAEVKRLEGIAGDKGTGGLSARQRVELWKPAETAIVICDMWDKHWCAHATARVAELAPALNNVINIARERGVKIIHAPSDTIGFYRKHPARKNAEKFKPQGRNRWNRGLESEQGIEWPVEHTRNGGCPECKEGRAWKRQIAALEIKDNDFISDNGPQIRAYFEKVGVKNVILTGVHTNMCVIGRPFGLRAMRQAGYNVALMRDMTDLMYNNVAGREQASQGGGRPFVSHYAGLDLMIEYIETYVAPTLLSSDFTGAKQFRFAGDPRPKVTFVSAESEYRSALTLTGFAQQLTRREIHTDFALGKPIMTGANRHDIQNLQALEDASLAVVFARRRGLEPAKMQLLKNYVASGRPLLGIRTASHAFDPRKAAPKGHVAWEKFDHDVLGGNYKGHYGHFKEGTNISIVTKNAEHPVLRGVAANFNSPSWLYINAPLTAKNAVVLLTGRDPGPKNKEQPVLWQNGNVIYTSLGHWDDWRIPAFDKLVNNAVDFLLKK